MSVTTKDQNDVESEIRALEAECTQLESKLPATATGYKRPDKAMFEVSGGQVPDVLLDLENLEAYAAQLRVAVRTGAAARPTSSQAQPDTTARSKFHDGREDLKDVQDDIATSELALTHYNAKLGLGGRTFLRRPDLTGDTDADLAALKQYQGALREALHEAAEKCYSMGLVQRPKLSDFPEPARKGPADKPKLAVRSEATPAAQGGRKLTATEKILAAKVARKDAATGGRKLTATEKVLAAKVNQPAATKPKRK